MALPPGPGKQTIADYLATASMRGPTLVTSQPQTLTQTWNAAGVTFTGLKVNITDTASAAASLLMDLQVAGASKFYVDKTGIVKAAGRMLINAGGAETGIQVDGADSLLLKANGVFTALLSSSTTFQLDSAVAFGWTDGTANGGTFDTKLVRDAANTIAQKNSNANQTHRWYSTNAAYCQIQSLSESHTLAAAATSDTTIQFPANSIGLGVTIRVTTLITGCATLDVGIAGATTRYGTGIALTANTTNTGVGLVNPSIYAAATKVRFSAIGGGASFTAGVIRVTMHYISLSAPTS